MIGWKPDNEIAPRERGNRHRFVFVVSALWRARVQQVVPTKVKHVRLLFMKNKLALIPGKFEFIWTPYVQCDKRHLFATERLIVAILNSQQLCFTIYVQSKSSRRCIFLGNLINYNVEERSHLPFFCTFKLSVKLKKSFYALRLKSLNPSPDSAIFIIVIKAGIKVNFVSAIS